MFFQSKWREKGNQRKDIFNPDVQLKKRPLLNLIILSDFIYSDGKWKQRHVYDPDNGKLYSAVLTLKSNQIFHPHGGLKYESASPKETSFISTGLV